MLKKFMERSALIIPEKFKSRIELIKTRTSSKWFNLHICEFYFQGIAKG